MCQTRLVSATRVELPSGIVTFVFTDIEGSTRLLHLLGDRYVEMLERHREILRAACSAHRGHEVRTEADSFFAAFDDATDAMAACFDAQLALAGEEWPEGVEVRVRMGVHTGLAAPHEGDYVALAVHQAARVVAAGHGGQILVSEDTAAALEPDGAVRLRPLGRYRLRDFPGPVRIYQVVGEGLEDHLPAIRAVPADGHNIVRKPTPTIGREETITALADLTKPGRPVTLIGPGGVGKSRVASDLGVVISSQWEDGVWMVNLAGVTEPELIPGAIAGGVGAPGHPEAARWDDVLRHLETRNAAVILDNCEHLAAAAAELIDSLLTTCERVGVITTSREPLRAQGEILWPIEPLPFPSGPSPRPEEVLESPAGRLFWERGTAVRPTFTIDEDNAATVAAIVEHLDGIPLLIELAAAHLSAQSPADILSGLEDRARLLRSPDPRVADRHGTMAGLLDWSYRLLEAPEQAALRRLSVFGASFSQWAAAAAVSDDRIDRGDVPHLLWLLVDRSLVVADLASNATRYRLLETVRSYGRRLLDEAGETDRVASGLAGWFLERLGPWFPADRQWVGEVGVELDNLRALIPLLPPADQESAQQIACSIGRHHDAAQTFREGIDELTRLAGLLGRPSPTRVALLATLAFLHLRIGQIDPARELVEAAQTLRDEYGAPDWDDVAVERVLGEIARRTGDLGGAADIAREALARPLSDRGRARMYNLLCTTSAALGELDMAYDACTRELALYQALGDEGYIASAHGNLAEVALRLGDMPAAARHQRSCLDLAVAQGSHAMVAFSLIVAARVARWRQDWATAASLHAKAEAMLEETGLVLYEDDRRESEQLLEAVRTELGEEEFANRSRAGGELSLPEGVALADRVLAETEQAQSAAGSLDRREGGS